MDLREVSKRGSDTSSRHPWELARLEVVKSLLRDTLKNEDDFTVLDIGCGDIFFITQLSKAYPQAVFYAIDTAFTDEIIAGLSEGARGRNIFLYKSLDEAAVHLKKPADLVLLLDVVEHIEDDKGFLKMLAGHSTIDANTRVMITVPAFQSMFCSHDHFLGHYRRYTNASLQATIEGAGFMKLKVGYFFLSLIPPRLLQVMGEGLRKKRADEATTGLVEWNKGSFVTGLFKQVLLLDFRFTRLLRKITSVKLPGLSNYILCKKAAS